MLLILSGSQVWTKYPCGLNLACRLYLATPALVTPLNYFIVTQEYLKVILSGFGSELNITSLVYYPNKIQAISCSFPYHLYRAYDFVHRGHSLPGIVFYLSIFPALRSSY